MASLRQLQDVSLRKTILLVGSPGAGKSTLRHQGALKRLTADQPVIDMTTKDGSSDAERVLKERARASRESENVR